MQMNLLYNIAIYITSFLLKIIALFNKKIKLFVDGRKNTFKQLDKDLSMDDDVIWFHCASLGEFEQGRPLIENIKTKYPDYKIILTFFSPSGLEVQKEYPFADCICYLPLDTKHNANLFLDRIHPKIAIFIKYEFWPNILNELKKREIETILVSGIFRKNQIFFSNYGAWLRRSLDTFSHFFVQNEVSKNLLEGIGIVNSTISGDTRFDRVFEITQQDNHLQFIEDFIQKKHTLVAGSTWPKDEDLLVDYINKYASAEEKFIIAPHNISEKGIERLKKSIIKPKTLFSDKNRNNNAQVLIVNTIGLLTKIYSYAQIAYVGGGFEKNGIHNVLEPAAYGVPLIIGPNFDKFIEAEELVNLKACKVVQDDKGLKNYLERLYSDKKFKLVKEKIAKTFIENNIGATELILNYIYKKI